MDGSSIIDFADKYDDMIVEGSVIVRQVSHDDGPRYLHGTCYECKKHIINRGNKHASEYFGEHICKEKKTQEQKMSEPKVKPPPDFKELWKEIGAMPMSERAKGRWEVHDELDRNYREHISEFVRWYMKDGAKAGAAVAQNKGLLKVLQAHVEIGDAFSLDENDEDMIATIVAQFKSNKTSDAKWAKKLEQTEARYEDEVQRLTMSNGELSRKCQAIQDNYLDAHKEISNLTTEVRRLQKELSDAKKSQTVANGFKVV